MKWKRVEPLFEVKSSFHPGWKTSSTGLDSAPGVHRWPQTPTGFEGCKYNLLTPNFRSKAWHFFLNSERDVPIQMVIYCCTHVFQNALEIGIIQSHKQKPSSKTDWDVPSRRDWQLHKSLKQRENPSALVKTLTVSGGCVWFELSEEGSERNDTEWGPGFEIVESVREHFKRSLSICRLDTTAV